MGNLIYQYDDFEDENGDEGMACERREIFAKPNQNRRGGFSNPKMGSRFPYPNHGRKEDTQILMSIT